MKPPPALALIFRSLLLAGMLCGSAPVEAANPGSWPATEILHEWLAGAAPDNAWPDPGDLEPLAYLEALSPAVLIGPHPESPGPSLSKIAVYPPDHGYLRVARVDASLPPALAEALDNLVRSNACSGVVLDLRFADGLDFPAAAAAAGLLAHRPGVAITLGERRLPIETRAPPGLSIVIVLANGSTSGAAEAMAAGVRRTARMGLTLGQPTAGRAREYEEVSVPDGGLLRLGGPPALVEAAEGAAPLSPQGLKPDLTVAVSAADEALHFEDEYRRVARGRPTVSGLTTSRLNEAELVRRQRGLRVAVPAPEPAPLPVVQDPVLARALDLLSGVARGAAEPASGGLSR